MQDRHLHTHAHAHAHIHLRTLHTKTKKKTKATGSSKYKPKKKKRKQTKKQTKANRINKTAKKGQKESVCVKREIKNDKKRLRQNKKNLINLNKKIERVRIFFYNFNSYSSIINTQHTIIVIFYLFLNTFFFAGVNTIDNIIYS